MTTAWPPDLTPISGRVVLLPGLDGTGQLFAPLIAAAPTGINCAVVDYPHHEASIDVLEQRVRKRLPGPCILIAESFSGPIAVRVASDARVKALVLCYSFVSGPLLPALRHIAIPALFKLPRPASMLRLLLLGRHAAEELVEIPAAGSSTGKRRGKSGTQRDFQMNHVDSDWRQDPVDRLVVHRATLDDTERLAIEVMTLKTSSGAEVKLEFETSKASMAPIYYIKYWARKYPILDKLRDDLK
jgi:hypothetical protein